MENFNNLSLASTLRGLYATPIICELSKKKVFERNSKKINLKALKKIKNKFILNLCLDYLEQIQITEKKNLSWEMSGLNLQNYLGNIHLPSIENKFLKKKVGKNKFLISKITTPPIVLDNNEEIMAYNLIDSDLISQYETIFEK